MKITKTLNASILALAFACTAGAQNAPEQSAVDATSSFPLKNVMLYSSGVGAFAHEGEIQGRANIRFRFDEKQLNDLLKSFFVTSSGKISIESVNFPSKLPLSEILKDSRVDVQSAPVLWQILQQLRGNEFVCKLSSGGEFSGRLTGIEQKTRTITEGAVQRSAVSAIASFVTENGLRSVDLEELTSISPKDKSVLKEMNQALASMAAYGEKGARDMNIHLTGSGNNLVRMAYVIESPVWKTSYRLRLDNDGKAFLQGWAIVENPTGIPWNNVHLSLVSGRPSSFVQDLYSSLYLQRPEMKRENYAAFAPVRHEVGRRDKFRTNMAAVPSEEKMEMTDSFLVGSARSSRMEMVSSAGTAVKTEAVGELFRYDIARAVTLGARESAMLEILGAPITADKKSIFNPRVNASRPMNAVELKNTTSMLLPQGPVTIFSGDTYGGDASLSDVPAGQSRMLSYGLDLEVLAEQSNPAWTSGVLVKLTLQRGVLRASYIRTLSNVYTFTNQSGKDKTLVIEHPRLSGGKLVSKEAPMETTANLYRFEIKVPAGKTATFSVREEQPYMNTYHVANLDISHFRTTVINDKLSAEAEAFFKQVAEIKAKLEDVSQEITDVDRLVSISSDAHARTRSSLNVISDSNYRSRLTATLTELDKKLFDLAGQKETLIARQRQLKKELNDFIMKAQF